MQSYVDKQGRDSVYIDPTVCDVHDCEYHSIYNFDLHVHAQVLHNFLSAGQEHTHPEPGETKQVKQARGAMLPRSYD